MQIFTPLLSGTQPGADSTAFLLQIGMLVLIFVILYFIFIRPQKKKDKEIQQMREGIQIGDEVTTVGGIVGIVVRKNDDTVVIETGGERHKLRVKLWAIQSNATLHDDTESR